MQQRRSVSKMMNAYVVTSLTLLALSLSIVADEPPKVDMCVEDGFYYEKGEQWQVKGECAQATCQEGGSITKLGCGQMRVDTAAGWTMTAEDPDKPYPECCSQPVPPPSTE